MVRQQQYIEALYNKTLSCIDSDEEFIIKMIDTMDDYVVYDSSDQKMQAYIEKFNDYEFLGINNLDGELKAGEQFLEFYPDEKSLWNIVIDLFYTPKTNDKE